jgi:hypothetical protein
MSSQFCCDVGIDRGLLISLILKKRDLSIMSGLNWLRTLGFLKYDNRPCGSTKGRKFLVV